MTTEYSAHPALAAEQLQRAEPASHHSSKAYSHHRRHNPSSAAAASGHAGSPTKVKPSTKAGKVDASPISSDLLVVADKAFPERTDFGEDDDDVNFADEEDNTKDCVDCAPSVPEAGLSIDEPDHLQHRFSRTHLSSRQHFHKGHTNFPDACSTATDAAHANAVDECVSGLSSAISSPSPSTVSSPLSTPTRLAPQLQRSHQQCCQKATAAAPKAASAASHHQLHHHHHHSSAAGGCKKLQKFDPRLGPSPYRQLLPIILCILSFATVFATLIIYMDTTEIRHQQFRLNMSRDYDLYGVAQDDPTLIAFLREIHMNKYPMHFLKNRETVPTTNLNFSAGHYDELTPTMAHYVADLLDGKANGAVIQSLPGALGPLMTAPWLSETLNWAGIIVEPEPRRYFTLRKQNAQRPRMQVVHACVSPNPYPKEITIHNEESEVRINSLLDGETTWFNSRVKCFPLYTIMLASNRVEYDLLSLGVHGQELEILQTLPFDKIQIEVISIHLLDDYEDVRSYVQSITKFLKGKSYKMQKNFGCNYFYQRINPTSRTRKKDILLLKTP